MNELIMHWQEQAQEHAAFAQWVRGKAVRQRVFFEAGEPNDYIIRRNQWKGEMQDAAICAATARALMGVNDEAES